MVVARKKDNTTGRRREKTQKTTVSKKTTTTKKPSSKEGEFTKLWETFRRKVEKKPGERKKAIETILKATRGKLFELSLKHVEARVVQTMLRYGDASQRAAIASELAPRFAELSKLPYARHVAIALARVGSHGREIYESVVPVFAKLAVHQVAAKVVDVLLLRSFLTTSQKKILRESLLFPRDLDTNIARGKTDRLLQKLADKALVHLPFAHDLLRNHAARCRGEWQRLRDLAPHFAEPALHVAATRAGALGLCDLVACADAKTRKKFVKALKSKVSACADHRHAYLVVWRLLDVVDDTVFTSKTLLASLVPIVPFSRGAARIVASLLHPSLSHESKLQESKLQESSFRLEPHETQILKHRPEEMSVGEVTASKKTTARRRQELREAATDLLNRAVSKDPLAFLASRFGGAPVLIPLLKSPAAVAALAQAATAASFRQGTAKEKETAAAAAAAEDDDDVDDETDAEFSRKIDAKLELGLPSEERDETVAPAVAEGSGTAILEHDVGHATLKALLQAEASAEGGHHALGRAFYDRVTGRFGAWVATNRGAFVIEALLRSDDAPFARDAARQAKKALAKVPERTAGAAALAAKLGVSY